ncbi:hypothetical protein SMB34_12840 [Thalassospira permensis NBRC 106175]|uniref:Uncharacterized protein n=1 Tax=Thalassospira permensis NBRC 106175 TaxID=1353532 RepID=A0ABR4TT01_9PROT|nr:hypothetical protein SMB34_12840 [Thalassospira permensis NBRC 106175]
MDLILVIGCGENGSNLSALARKQNHFFCVKWCGGGRLASAMLID